MTEQDFGQFSAVMAALCEYYGKPKLSDMAVGLYFAALLEYPLADVQQGLTAGSFSRKRRTSSAHWQAVAKPARPPLGRRCATPSNASATCRAWCSTTPSSMQ